MKTLTVRLAERSYDIHIARGLLDEAGGYCRALLPGAGKLAVVTDTNVAPLYGERVVSSLKKAGFETRLLTVPAGERSKNTARLGELWEGFAAFGLTPADAVVALGGGVVGDLAGFAAATFLRGVDFIQIPTTLLAQTDSAVGGKTAVNLAAGKNLAGAFHQPRLVLTDPDTLDTLPRRVFSDGMAEVIKYGCIGEESLFAALEQNPTPAGVREHMEEILFTCCDFKRRVVEQDEKDTAGRRILNFGHTLGHAYERAGGYEKYTHGEGVAAGMVAAAKLGEAMGVTPAGTAARIAALLEQFSLPTAIPCTAGEYEAAIALDKKGAGEEISFVLLEELGRAFVKKLPREELLARISGLGL